MPYVWQSIVSSILFPLSADSPFHWWPILLEFLSISVGCSFPCWRLPLFLWVLGWSFIEARVLYLANWWFSFRVSSSWPLVRPIILVILVAPMWTLLRVKPVWCFGERGGVCVLGRETWGVLRASVLGGFGLLCGLVSLFVGCCLSGDWTSLDLSLGAVFVTAIVAETGSFTFCSSS